jgi:hypothetical protein
MKKILTIVSLVAVTTLLHAQGYIEFYGSVANIQTNTVASTFFGDTGTGGAVGKISPASTGNVYDFVLLYESTTLTGNSAPTNSAWTPVLNWNGGSPVAFAAGSITNGVGPGSVYGPNASAGQQVNLAAGTAYSVELVGWSASLGSFANVLSIIQVGYPATSGFLGWTTVGTVTPFATAGIDPTLFNTIWANGTMVLYALPTPEPSTMALAGVGGLSLWLIRRRK